MIPVVQFLQFRFRFLFRHIVCCPQLLYAFFEYRVQLLLCDTANPFVILQHRYIPQIVQVAEHTHLSELRHPRKQGEPDISVHRLQRPIESLQRVPVLILQFIIVYGLQHRLVVLVNQDNSVPSRLLRRPAYNPLKSCRQRILIRILAVQSLTLFQEKVKLVLQILRSGIPFRIQIQMQYRMYRPFLLQFRNLQPLEHLPLSAEISFQRRDKQTLAEPARTAQEVIYTVIYQVIYQIRLVYVKIPSFAYLFKILYSYRVFHASMSF